MYTESISIKGTGEWNEDSLIVNEELGLYGVIDGATSLQPYRGPNGETGGYLASNIIKDYILSLSKEDARHTSLYQIVLQANERLKIMMQDSGIDLADKTSLWTCALVIIRVKETFVEYAQVGDCMMTVVYNDGSLRVVTRDQVDHVGRESRQIWIDGIQKGIKSRDELWSMVKPILIKNKYKMNTINGYSVLNGRPEVASYIEYGCINRINMKNILLVSDGLFLPRSIQEADEMDWIDIVRRIEASNLSGYANWLVQLESNDLECQLYPRLKISDDKTGIWIDVVPE